MSSQTSSRLRAQALPYRIGSLIIPSDPYWVQALEAIIHTNQKIGDELVLLQPAATIEELHQIPVEDLVDQILAHSLDALITTIVSIPVIEALVNEGLPVISLAELEFRHPLFTAMEPLYEGGRIAGQFIAERLAGKGHAICVSADCENLSVRGQHRYAGFRDSMLAFPGITAGHVPAYWSYAKAYPHLLSALKDYPKPIDAIFGVSDTIIFAARDAGRCLGIVDDHTVLVGLNGDAMALAAISEGELCATIDTSSEILGANAAETAHEMAMGKLQPGLLKQRYQLITRENVATIATRKLVAIANIPTRMVGYSRQQENEQLAQLKISMEITRQTGPLLERERLVQAISELVAQHYGYDWMRILRWSKKEKKLVFDEGTLSPASKQVPVEQDVLLQQAFSTNETIFIPDLQTSLRRHLGSEWDCIRSRAILPIQLGSEVIGILDLQSAKPVRQPTMEMVGLKLLASQLGIAMQNADLYLEALQAREVAERANQLKTRLVANVGHEMRTPLNAILGFSQSILKKIREGEPIDPEMLGQDVGYIYKSGEHLMFMINDLLDLSRAEIGALNLYFEPLQPVPFLQDVFQNLAQCEPVSGDVQWWLDIPERLPVIRADTVRLRQILNNLLTNARKFTRQGTITLGARVELPYLHLWVEDTGQGVPIELQEKIFEPFSTTGRKRRPEGIGLGLSITRHLVGLHDGLITLESTPGVGSTFHVYLPLPGIAKVPVPSADAAGLPLLLVMSPLETIPPEIEQICQSHKLAPRLIRSREDINQALAEGAPAAIAWDLANASSFEWSLIYRLSTDQKCVALPVILFARETNSEENGASLTNLLFKPCNSNVLKDWISQLGDQMEQGESILVVDDDPQAREYYQGLIKSIYPQCPVLLAEDGSQALAILESTVPSFVLLDLIMPGVDGFCVLEHIRNNPRTQHIPVVIISGKLLSYEDIQRLNHYRTIFYNKGILTDEEAARLLERKEGWTTPLPHATSMVVKQGIAFLHQNYHQPLSRKAIANAVGVSENYLSQIFRQEMGITPWDYLNRLRIQKARELLQNSQESVTCIAISVGFNDPAYFSRVFHKLTGQSPHEYRQAKQK